MSANRNGATLFAFLLATTMTTQVASSARADEPSPSPTPAIIAKTPPTATATTTTPTTTAATTAPEPAQLSHAESPIADALERFDFGDYEAVVNRLRPIVENGARELPLQVDRVEALRVYGIACTLTDRKTAAEGAFLLLLREEPQTRLDPRLVRPEAVAFFDEVRSRHREELLAVYRRTVPRYNWALDVVPVVGQFQNHQRAKGFVLGGLELALLGGTIVTYSLLTHFEGHDHTFAGHESLYTSARGINITCFTALLAVTAYGIIDAFVIGAQRHHRERDVEARLLF